MDARSFGIYLKNILEKKAKEFENGLLSVQYDNLGEAKRISGVRDTLVGIANSIDSVIKDFYATGGVPLPDSTVGHKDDH